MQQTAPVTCNCAYACKVVTSPTPRSSTAWSSGASAAGAPADLQANLSDLSTSCTSVSNCACNSAFYTAPTPRTCTARSSGASSAAGAPAGAREPTHALYLVSCRTLRYACRAVAPAAQLEHQHERGYPHTELCLVTGRTLRSCTARSSGASSAAGAPAGASAGA